MGDAYGPVQACRAIGLARFQLERALSEGLVDGLGAAAVEAARPRREAIVAAVGTLPDLGAVRAAEHLEHRFGLEVPGDAVDELARRGTVPIVDTYRDHNLFCGRALERLDDPLEVRVAAHDGRCYTASQAAELLRLRRRDLDHLTRAGWLVPVRWTRARGAPRRVRVPLYRRADLDALTQHPLLDAARAVPAGRRSPLSRLPDVTSRPSPGKV